MTTLSEFDVEPAREVRTPKRVDGLDYLACPCSSPLVESELTTVEVSGDKASPGVLDDDDVLLFRGWDCSACSRIVIETADVARDEGRERDLRDGWLAIGVDVDVEENALGFAPERHVDELVDGEVSDE